MNYQRLLEMEFWGNTIPEWAVALLAFAVTFLVLPLVRGYIRRLRKRMTGTRHATAVEVATVVASRTTRLFLWTVAVWIGASLLELPERFERRIDALMLIVLWLQVGAWCMAAAGYFIDRQRARAVDRGLSGSLDLIGFLVRGIIWALVLLLLLDNLGIEVTPLVAGLGITGIAVALAVQSLLGDLLASLSIALDKPFVVGDYLVVDKDQGTVEKIGVKSTRLRSIDGEQVIVSNADLLKSRVHNYGRMYQRRAVFQTHVRYETPPEKLREVTRILEAAVRAQAKTRFERSHFARHGDFSLVFETVYFVLDAEYNLYMDIQQAINLRVHEEFAKLDIPFAFRDRLAAHEFRRQREPPPTGGTEH
jgi:small-conductance mechanosensitive channel